MDKETTAGPWHWHREGDENMVYLVDESISSVIPGVDMHLGNEHSPNALLIAAAPCLLTALEVSRQFLAFFDEQVEVAIAIRKNQTEEVLYEMTLSDAMKRVVAALDAAKGIRA